MYKNTIKPVFDFLVACIVLILLSPLFLILMLVVKISSKGPIFFIHPRPGYKGKVIKIIKFRTMDTKINDPSILSPNNQRITKIGAIMRKYSLDEIPQLINVVKGDISLVGPRPLEIRYLPYYSSEQRRRHNVKPGMTGLAQVNGRNNISWEEKFKFDLWYIDHISLNLDLKILFLTIIKALNSEGINYDSNTTMVPFDIYLGLKEKNEK